MTKDSTNLTNKTDFPGTWRRASAGYRYFLPGNVFATKELDIPLFVIKQMEQASLSLGRFATLTEKIPNPLLFISANMHKEATLSSRIEGTQTEIQDAFMTEEDIAPEKRDDHAEVRAYVRSMKKALKDLEELPLCNRLIKNAHYTLLSQVRGRDKLPGEFRSSQNWIGGSRPDNARFVPPHHKHIDELMSQLEKFIHDDTTNIPHLIKAALVHYQFESIHPFLDGNGRIGRMIIPLYLLDKEIITSPFFYVSQYFEQHRNNYYDALDRARENHKGLVHWISFFLDAVEDTAKRDIETTTELIEYQRNLCESVLPNHLGSRTKRGLALLEFLFKRVGVNTKMVQKELNFSPQVSHALLNEFVDLEILKELTGQKRNRLFLFSPFLDILMGKKKDQ